MTEEPPWPWGPSGVLWQKIFWQKTFFEKYLGIFHKRRFMFAERFSSTLSIDNDYIFPSLVTNLVHRFNWPLLLLLFVWLLLLLHFLLAWGYVGCVIIVISSIQWSCDLCVLILIVVVVKQQQHRKNQLRINSWICFFCCGFQIRLLIVFASTGWMTDDCLTVVALNCCVNIFSDFFSIVHSFIRSVGQAVLLSFISFIHKNCLVAG